MSVEAGGPAGAIPFKLLRVQAARHPVRERRPHQPHDRQRRRRRLCCVLDNCPGECSAAVNGITVSGPPNAYLYTLLQGFNRVVRPLLLRGDTAPFVTFDFGMSRMTVTLPPVPGYFPSSDETVSVVVPGLMLRSGRSTPLEGLSISIAADSTDCTVGPWTAWSTCSAQCGPGLQTRSRPVTTYAVGAAAAICPPTVETRPCNVCDACSGVTCLNGGLCALAACACAPGWSGADCSVPPAGAVTPFWATSGAWGPCSDACGGDGTQTRALTCAGATATGVITALPASACARLGAPPAAVRTCNVQPCTEQRLALSVALALPGGALGLASASAPPATQWDAFAAALVQDLAAAVGVSTLRMRVIGVAPPAVGANTSLLLSVVTVSVLPPSSSYAATLNASRVSSAELPGNDLPAVLTSLLVREGACC